ncbi:MAG TPA: dual specificity protein phosphatase family protein [Terriglobales bacterium]|nr:dual specificity protein phosphatase family protein [Terriglobales bacterium]
MDLTYILERRLAVGGGIWTIEAMSEVSRMGFTHVVDLQAEFDDTALASHFGIQVLWLPVEDDFAPKTPELLEQATRFAVSALRDPEAQVYVHCAAGIHRGPLAAAAVLCGLGLDPAAAMEAVLSRRVLAEFPEAYRGSLESWYAGRGR